MKIKKVLTILVLFSMMLSLISCKGESKKVEEYEDESIELMENIDEYDFSNLATEYLNYIGTNLTNRDVTDNDSDHQATIDWIVSELINAGYSQDQINVITVEDPIASISNIELVVPGANHEKQIIVGGHYDGDGVGDNGSGVALMLATAVGLVNKTPLYDVKYVFFDGEEIGMVGSSNYAESMSEEDISRTLYMVNIDSIAFGDYVNVYGGTTDGDEVIDTKAYELAVSKARYLGFGVWGPDELDGYFAEHDVGPDIEVHTIYTNPWTASNPAPSRMITGTLRAYSPSTIPYSDHVFFAENGISYVYFEATNWFTGSGNEMYTGYCETYDLSVGDNGMFMNTKYDTLEELNRLFPGRAQEHFAIYSPLLSSLVLNPEGESITQEI